MISLERKYELLFRQNCKRIEVRTRVPRGLERGDWLMCCRVASGGVVPIALRVAAIERVWEFQWHNFDYKAAGLTPAGLRSYVCGRDPFYGIHVDKVVVFRVPYKLGDFGLTRSPQWFSRVRRLPIPEIFTYINERL